MKRFFLDLVLAGSFTGFGYLISPVMRPYSLCDVARYPGLFAGRTVVIRGTLYGSSSGVIHLAGDGCAQTDDAWATVENDEYLNSEPEAHELLTGIRNLASRDTYIRAQVIVTGDLEDLGRPCFAPRFLITARRMHQLGPARLEAFPGE